MPHGPRSHKMTQALLGGLDLYLLRSGSMGRNAPGSDPGQATESDDGQRDDEGQTDERGCQGQSNFLGNRAAGHQSLDTEPHQPAEADQRHGEGVEQTDERGGQEQGD